MIGPGSSTPPGLFTPLPEPPLMEGPSPAGLHPAATEQTKHRLKYRQSIQRRLAYHTVQADGTDRFDHRTNWKRYSSSRSQEQ
jgi:hypothetical protein